MGQTDKQFGGFLRMVIRDLKDLDKKHAILEALLSDLQNTLED